MNHYRVYKLREPGGRIVKGKDIQVPTDEAAMDHAHADEDCPICEIWRGTKKVGSID